MNCTEGFSWSVWENMMFGADIVDPSGGGAKKYIMSTGGDFNPKNGKAWPGFSLPPGPGPGGRGLHWRGGLGAEGVWPAVQQHLGPDRPQVDTARPLQAP